MPSVITFVEFLKYREDITRLKGWFMWHWVQSHDEPLVEVFRHRVNLMSRTPYFRGGLPNPVDIAESNWVALERQVVELLQQARSDSNSDRFKENLIDLFRPALLERAQRDFPKRTPAPEGSCVGSLVFHPDPKRPGRAFVHIYNAVTPYSIFADPKYIRSCLLEGLDFIERELDLKVLGTHTWLNSYPKWLSYFPKEYRDNFLPPNQEVAIGDQFWGQFVNARGCFNEKHGAVMRQTGNFPFATRYSHCSIGTLRQYLEESPCGTR